MSSDKFSRQELTFGVGVQTKLSNCIIRVNNLAEGLATEVCKNLVLQGIGNLILSDNSKITKKDLETGFYYQNNLNKKRKVILKEKLEKLNPSCRIFLDNSKIPDLEIFLNNKLEYSSSIPMIYSRVGGTSGFIFNDFKSHLVTDLDGEFINKLVIKKLEKLNDSEIMVQTTENHSLSDEYTIEFSNLDGDNLEFLKGQKKIKVINPLSFIVYINNEQIPEFKFINGNVTRIKQPKTIKFNSLEDELKEPSLLEDMFNPDKPKQLFNYWMTDELKPEDKLSFGPVNSYFGGLIASEAIKFITNKYLPISQWYFWEDKSYLNYYPNGSNNTEKLVGKETYQKMINGKWFLIGSGAIGCEMLKNLALMNFATQDGKIYVTDPDTIEVSNLSRQFLFHEQDLNKSKSYIAGLKIKEFNNKINVDSRQDKMCSETEKKYNKSFYQDLDGLINALDNYDARLYMDNKAVENSLPLFESGTQGMKGNTQPVIPHLTENYGASSDPPESESYPLCTIKNFPNKPEHVIHYQKELFNEWLNDFPTKVNKYLKNKKYLDELAETDRTEFIKKLNMFFKFSNCWEDQVEFWNQFYNEYYYKNISSVLDKYPKDHMVNGELYWSNGKKCPHYSSEELKFQFIKSSLKISEILYQKKFSYQKDDLINCFENKKELEDIKVNESEIKCFPINLNPIDYDKDIPEHYCWLNDGAKIRAESYQIDFPDVLQVRKISGKIIPALATTTTIVSGLISIEIIKYYQNKKIDDYKSYFLNLGLNLYLSSEPNPPKKTDLGTVWDRYEVTEDITVKKLIEKFNETFETEITFVVSDNKIIHSEDLGIEENYHKKLSELELGNNFTILTSSEEIEELPPILVSI